MRLRTSLVWVLGVTAALTVAGYGCSSSSGGRGTGGASGATANAGTGNNNGGSANNNGGSSNNGGSANNNGGSGSNNMDMLANQVKKPAAASDTGAPDGEAAFTDAMQAGEGGLVANTAQAGDEGDSVWQELEDIDGDGVEDEVSVLVDDETGDKYVWYTTVIAEFCTDGSDANSNVILVYTAEDDAWTMLWDSDCPEDEGLIYACGLDAEGNAENCDVCSVDSAGELQCLGGTGTDPGTDPGAADAGGGGEVPVTGEVPAWDCACLADCDGVPYESTEIISYCAEEQGSALSLAEADCYGSFEPGACIELYCECLCEDSGLVCAAQ